MKDYKSKYLKSLKRSIDGLDMIAIKGIADALLDAYENNRHIFIFGNGGSASTASHFACDLSKGTLANVYNDASKRFRVISLTDNVALATAFGNDLSFDDIFVQQLKNLINKDDVVIAISASGNSPNVIKALQYAKKSGAVTVGLLGFKTGGRAAKHSDHKIIVDDEHYGRVEDMHLIIQHMICDYLMNLRSNKK